VSKPTVVWTENICHERTSPARLSTNHTATCMGTQTRHLPLGRRWTSNSTPTSREQTESSIQHRMTESHVYHYGRGEFVVASLKYATPRREPYNQPDSTVAFSLNIRHLLNVLHYLRACCSRADLRTSLKQHPECAQTVWRLRLVLCISFANIYR
jgi:hypothetical protein